jgi:adenylate cyclase
MQTREFFTGLKERHLYRVAVIYAASAWLVLQVADIVVDSFDGPSWVMRTILALALGGFPLALVVAWIVGAKKVMPDPPVEGIAYPPVSLGNSPSLVILPFDVFSDVSSDRWYTDALVEDLTTLVSRLPGFLVVARNTAFTYRGKSIDVRALGSDLGVRYVLEGSVRRSSTGLRVTAQLVETETGAHLWAEQYDRGAAQFEQLHDELCQQIVQKLGAELTRAEVALSARIPPAEWGVWELYQQAKGQLQFSGWNEHSFSEIVRLLEEALELDPDYAPARSYLALILALGHWMHMFPNRDEVYARAMAEAEKSIALAPDSSEVLGFSGCAFSDLGMHDRGIPLIERAIELNPSNSQAHAALGAAKVISGRLEEGIEDLSHAILISPADPGLAPWSTLLSVAETYSGNPDKGLEWAERSGKSDPRYYGAQVARAVAYAGQQEIPRAQAALDEAVQVYPALTERAVSGMLGRGPWEMLKGQGLAFPGN